MYGAQKKLVLNRFYDSFGKGTGKQHFTVNLIVLDTDTRFLLIIKMIFTSIYNFGSYKFKKLMCKYIHLT